MYQVRGKSQKHLLLHHFLYLLQLRCRSLIYHPPFRGTMTVQTISSIASRKFPGSLNDPRLMCFFESDASRPRRAMRPALSHRASQKRTGRSLEPAIEKAVGFCFHVIREAMPSREKDGLEPFRHSFLALVPLRFLHQATHSIDGEEGISFSRRQQRGTRGYHHCQRVHITDL